MPPWGDDISGLFVPGDVLLLYALYARALSLPLFSLSLHSMYNYDYNYTRFVTVTLFSSSLGKHSEYLI